MTSLGQDRLSSKHKLPSNDRQDRQQFLKFYLQSDVAMLMAIESVTELINIPIVSGADRENRVIPMPHLPSAVLGVYNWRGEILWIVNLAKLLGLNPLVSTLQSQIVQPTIVIKNAPTSLGSDDLKSIGIVVDTITEIEWYEPHLNPDSVISNPLYSSLLPWFKSYWRSATDEILVELDAQILIDRADLHADL